MPAKIQPKLLNINNYEGPNLEIDPVIGILYDMPSMAF